MVPHRNARQRPGLWTDIVWSPSCPAYSVIFRKPFDLFCNGKCLKHQILLVLLLSGYWSFWCCSCNRLGEGECVFLFPQKQTLLIKCESCFQPRVPFFWSPVSSLLCPCLLSLAFFWIPATLTCPSWASSPFPKVLWIPNVNVHLLCSCCQTGVDIYISFYINTLVRQLVPNWWGTKRQRWEEKFRCLQCFTCFAGSPTTHFHSSGTEFLNRHCLWNEESSTVPFPSKEMD